MNQELKPCRCGFEPYIYSDGAVQCKNPTCSITAGDTNSWNRIMDTSVEDQMRAELLRKTEQLERIKECYYGIDDAATSGDMIDLVFGIRKLKGML